MFWLQSAGILESLSLRVNLEGSKTPRLEDGKEHGECRTNSVFSAYVSVAFIQFSAGFSTLSIMKLSMGALADSSFKPS